MHVGLGWAAAAAGLACPWLATMFFACCRKVSKGHHPWSVVTHDCYIADYRPDRTVLPPALQHYRKNQYEEALFRAEDDHFELDMIIDQNASAMNALQPLAAALEGMSEEERAGWQLPERALRAFHYRAVQRIYGEQGAQVVALLRQNPAVAVPTVLNRLTQKDVEWRQVRLLAARGMAPRQASWPAGCVSVTEECYIAHLGPGSAEAGLASRLTPPARGFVTADQGGDDADVAGHLQGELPQVAGPPLLLLQAGREEEPDA